VPITYDAPNKIITVTGFTEGTPCTYEDLYQADQSGGWGVITKQGIGQYLIDCRIIIGDGSTDTWFAGEDVQIEFTDTVVTKNFDILHNIKYNGHFRYGKVENESKKISSAGVSVYVACDTYYGLYLIYCSSPYVQKRVELYSSHFSSKSTHTSYPTTIFGLRDNCPVWHCIFNRFQLKTCIIDGFNILILSVGFTFAYGVGGIMDDVTVHKGTYAFYALFNDVLNIKNVTVKDSTYLVRSAMMLQDQYFVNVDAETWNFLYVGSGNGKIWRQYEFDVHCQDKDGNDLSGVSIVGEYIDPYGQAFSETSDVNGDIPTQTVDRSWYERVTGDTENLKTPLKVTYSKAGYQTVVKYYDLDEKTKDTVVLHKAVGVFLDFGRPIVNLKKTDPENKNVMVL